MSFKTIALFAAIVVMAFVSSTSAASLNSPFEYEIDPVGEHSKIYYNFFLNRKHKKVIIKLIEFFREFGKQRHPVKC